ncbi:type II toxin-antitoxin system RelE/ParE family toxin [Pelagicoccus albus]|uniref:Type II toxin-antitoxin system RelE/ParE family toxin n=1 Tax=Pelagicoccus albus TaxID=415222 RepID=A0A7X1E9F4_9BACT|nr:type II toxin-antitoxin system RelE/ParE family toxin [Pelagicoccus albus]MBC2605737.1 type II toxin-antitoxin system RelE/ParE family toxin [Pelagicoccus albus]
MRYELIVRNEAQSDIREIVRWYEKKEKGLGNYFLLCLDASLESLKRFPTAARIIRHEYRRLFVRKFPVGVYYIVQEDKVFIDVVEPFSRNPSRLEQKLKEG